ncbi:MAG: DUF998 domain-containing protein [Rhodanobacteraceae bacterium]
MDDEHPPTVGAEPVGAGPTVGAGVANVGGLTRVDPVARALGIVTLIGVAVISVICILVQFLRTDLSWIATPMSIYVIGRWGVWVQASFFAPAPGIAALGVGWYLVLGRRARSLIPLALFVAAGVALCFVGAFVTDTTPWPVTLHGKIHMWAAFSTFVLVTTAMVVQSWCFRLDPRWRKHFPDAVAIAGVTIVYFWVYALFHPIPRGIGEKVFIGLVLLWLWRAAWRLVRGEPR